MLNRKQVTVAVYLFSGNYDYKKLEQKLCTTINHIGNARSTMAPMEENGHPVQIEHLYLCLNIYSSLYELLPVVFEQALANIGEHLVCKNTTHKNTGLQRTHTCKVFP